MNIHHIKMLRELIIQLHRKDDPPYDFQMGLAFLALDEAEDDARKLWAIHVLDEYEKINPNDIACVCNTCGHFAHAGGDVNRLSSAEVIFHELPVEVQSILGPKP